MAKIKKPALSKKLKTNIARAKVKAVARVKKGIKRTAPQHVMPLKPKKKVTVFRGGKRGK